MEHTVQMHDNTDTGKTEWINLNGSELKHVFHVRIWIIWLTIDNHDYINHNMKYDHNYDTANFPDYTITMLMLKSQWNGSRDTFLPYCDIGYMKWIKKTNKKNM